jgi:hypothetical protein
MALELAVNEIPAEIAKKVMYGTERFSMQSPERLKIHYGEVELLNSKVPTGKQWNVVISVQIQEVDV